MATLFEKLPPDKKSLVVLAGLTCLTIATGAQPEAHRLSNYSKPVPYPTLIEHIQSYQELTNNNPLSTINAIVGYGGALVIITVHNYRTGANL